MDMYFMTLKEFVKHFIKMVDNRDVLGYQYVLISNTLKSDSSMDNVSKMSPLYPSARLVSDWLCDKDEEDFIERYFEELNENRAAVVTLLDCVLSQDIDTILISGVEESERTPYMNVLAEYIYSEFGVPVYEFKALRKGKDEFTKWDQKKAFEAIHEEFKEYTENIDLDNLGNHARNELLKTMSKKRLRKEVRALGMSKQTTNEMSRKELIETLNDLYGSEYSL